MLCLLLGIVFLIVVVKIILVSSSMPTYDGCECLVGKIAIVTGGNRGIGLEIVKGLALRGCKVIIGCRTNQEEVKRRVIDLTHNENIIVRRLDLLSYESVREFAKEIHETETKIDILINNAGIGLDLEPAASPLHPVLKTNIYSAFLLTHLLIYLLKKSEDGRILFTSSILAFWNNLSPKTLNPKITLGGQDMSNDLCNYGNSKLSQIIVSNILSEKLMEYGIKSNAVHPGIIKTEIWSWFRFPKLSKSALLIKMCFQLLILCFSRSSYEAAQSIIALATSDKYKNTTGQFYWGFRMINIFPNPPKLNNKKFCSDIWHELEILAELKPEEKL